MSNSTEDIFLSGIRETSSRTNVFRPKELREVVFPGLGMIMHSLFWVKHIFYLSEHGYDTTNQDGLMLWADDGEPKYTEGLLFYCISSHMDTTGQIRVNAGEKTTRNWLFRRDTDRSGGIYEQLAENLRSLTTTPTDPDYATFIEATFAPWFRTRCEELDIDLEHELNTTIGPVLDISNPSERDHKLAATFATLVGQIVKNNPTLKSGKNLEVISTTTRFAQRVYKVATPEHRGILANTNFEFTAGEAEALLEAVGRIENGDHFLHSVIFMLYLDPVNHSRNEIEQQMRHLYDFVGKDAEGLVAQVQSDYQLSIIDENITTDIEATAFYWILNFFMADGETIARDLLEETPSPLAVEDIKQYFSENPTNAKRFQSFFDYTDQCSAFLSTLAAETDVDSVTPTGRFIQTLQDGLSEERTPAEIFLDLLVSQNTLKRVSEGQYQIITRPQNTNAASFYGIGPLVSWAEMIATSIQS